MQVLHLKYISVIFMTFTACIRRRYPEWLTEVLHPNQKHIFMLVYPYISVNASIKKFFVKTSDFKYCLYLKNIKQTWIDKKP